MKKNLLYLLIGLVLMFFALFLFTRPAIFNFWDFSETGQIGDTIGGITAPIINLIGAFLVYISFKEQLNANILQQKSLDLEKKVINNKEIFDRYYTQVTEIKNRLHMLEYIKVIPGYMGATSPVDIKYSGINALYEFTKQLKNKSEDQIDDPYCIMLSLHSMLTQMKELLGNIVNNVNKAQDKSFLINTLQLHYMSYIKVFNTDIINDFPSGTSISLKCYTDLVNQLENMLKNN